MTDLGMQGVPFLMRRYMNRKHSPFTGSLRQSVIDVFAVAAAAMGTEMTNAALAPRRRGWYYDARIECTCRRRRCVRLEYYPVRHRVWVCARPLVHVPCRASR